MEKSTPVFKFATLRNPSDVVTTNEHQIKPETALSLELRSINLSDIEYKLKMDSLNSKIQGFIDTSDYIRTKEDFATIKNETPSETILNVLFDNIIVRTLTRDTTNVIYKLITAHIVVVFKTLNSIPEVEKCRIVIPEGLAIAINEAPEDAEVPEEDPIVDQKAILKEINMLSEFEQKNKGKVKSELIDEMDGILALKLDNSFPTDFMDNINTALAKYIKIENELRVLISKETEESQKLEYSNQLDQEFEKIICIVKSKFSVYFSAKESTLKDRKAIVKIIEKWLDEYGESNNIPPWATKKSILATAMEGYSYGTERGQIRDISDHNHIIPLYDFGVGVYDFDMSKIQPMIELAKQESEKHVNDFFKKIGEKVI